MNMSEADSALQQQSKRLAGLSITNATGAKVNILNDHSADPGSSPKGQSSPRSLCQPPHSQENFDRRRDYPAEEHSYAQHHSHHPAHNPKNHYVETNFEAGRSSSLTNASTPTYSSLEPTTSNSSPNGMLTASHRSRSLSSGSALSPRVSSITRPSSSSNSSVSVASPTFPPFIRSYSEDNQSDDSESGRGMSDPSSTSAPGPTFIKRKYSCSFPGCNKCFTTSKFSRQDNMMQHYRTHVSPKSRRGTTKKQETHDLGSIVNNSQETFVHSGQEHSPVMGYYGGEHDQQQQSQHQHITKMGTSRQNSPPRFNPIDRSGNVEYAGRYSADGHGSGGSIRHKKSGVIQTHQHHTPMPHFNVQAMSQAHQQAQAEAQTNPQSTLPSPLTPTIAQAPAYHRQPAYVPPAPYAPASRQQELYMSNKHTSENKSPSSRYQSDAVLASPTSPLTQDVKRMEGVTPPLEHGRIYHDQHHHHHQQYQSQASSGPHHQYQHHQHHHHQHQQNPSHVGHAQSGHSSHNNGYQLPPLTHQGQGQERKVFDRSLGNHLSVTTGAPPSPQSTPHTPTKYRFDPIQDCLQQEKQQREQHRDHRELHYDTHARFASHYYGAAAAAAAAAEDEEMSDTTRSSIMSSTPSMTSISSVSSSSLPITASRQLVSGPPSGPLQTSPSSESNEEMSGLAHLAQIVTTYG
ncbi:hypothetical protein BGZ58_007773 [Dissophora ornata]|nr:hypothetical protein BGZ58_007773 [Dissophora ornata]